MKNNTLHAAVICALLTMGAGTALPAVAQVQEAAAQAYQISAGDLDAVLRQYATLNKLQLAYPVELVEGKRSSGLSGTYTQSEALRLLLQGSGLEAWSINARTIGLRKADAQPAVPTRKSGASAKAVEEGAEGAIVGMPAIMVKGARTLNMDIERTVDDPQPYVVFDRIAIERAGAANLNDFLKTRLPMNATLGSSSQRGFDSGNGSSINLRGLGETQTLILIDGRRLAKTSNGDTSGQPDINGIPMGAIERIEVLPATASAIYGGSATGGVINIILRRGYQGTEVTLNYDNSFDTDSAIRRIDISSGFSLFGGRTSVLLTGSYGESNSLLLKDRDFLRRGWDNMFSNNPALHASYLPVGAGANIRSANGSELIMKDGTRLGSSFTSAPTGYGGIRSDGGAALLTNAGTYNLDYSNTAELYEGGRSPLSPNLLNKYFSASVSHEFSNDIRGFVEASRSENISNGNASFSLSSPVITLPASAPTNPFNQNVIVSTVTSALDGSTRAENTYDRYSGGLVFNLPSQWMGAVDYTYSRAGRISGATGLGLWSALRNAAIASGELDILSDLSGADFSDYVAGIQREWLNPLEVTTKNPAIRISGPVGSLKGGKPTVSLLLERQDTEFGPAIYNYRVTNGNLFESIYPRRSQNIDSAYVELRIPVVSSMNALPWMKEFELQLAGRWDKYDSNNANRSLNGTPILYVKSKMTEVTPLLAVRLRPIDTLAIRASYGEGFLPPDINQMVGANVAGAAATDFADPLREGTVLRHSLDFVVTGGEHLAPEYSKNWSLGAIYTPEWSEDLRISVDYSNLSKEGNIVSLSAQQTLDNERYFPERVIRGENLPTDPAGWAGPVVGLDRSFINAASSKLEAFDLQADYTLHTADKGTFTIFAVATYQTRYDVKLSPASPYQDTIGVASYLSVPLELKGNLGMEWTSDALTLGWNGRYASSYYVADPTSTTAASYFAAQGNGGRVPSQTYHDVFGKYQFASDSRGTGTTGNLLSGLELQVGIRNLFNKIPPYDYQSFLGYYSTLGDPRLRTYYVTLRKSF